MYCGTANDFRLIGQINGYDVYTKGVDEREMSAVVGVYCELPEPEELWDSFVQEWLVDKGTQWSCWMRFQYDSWGASYVFEQDAVPAITATIGHHGGRPIMLEVICATGDDKGPGDVAEFIDGLYNLVRETLMDAAPTLRNSPYGA